MAEPFWTRVLQQQEGEPDAASQSDAQRAHIEAQEPAAPSFDAIPEDERRVYDVTAALQAEDPSPAGSSESIEQAAPIAHPEAPLVEPPLHAAHASQDEPLDSSIPFASQEELLAQEEAAKVANTYKPAALPDDIHSIEVNRNKFGIGAEDRTESYYESKEDVANVSEAHLDDILRAAMSMRASDIHLTVGLPPMVRVDGEVKALPYSVLTGADTRRVLYDILTDEQLQKFEQTHEADFSYGVSGLARFRCNVYMQRGSIGAALRSIPTKIPAFEDLGLPNVIRDMCNRTSGLVLVTGPTGSGKSTTIATMLNDINDQLSGHIMTIEDPIEYLHNHKKCIVNQRELHSDTYSFHNALRAVLREDPDIILVGELRDLETIEAALTLAETGHLVFGTLHTRNAPATIDRVVDVFPSDQQAQIRVLLGNTLEGVISQQLLPRLGGGRSAALEIMIGIPAIKNLIREGKTHQMYSIIETNQQIGMQTMDRSLADLFRTGMCSYDECLMRAVDKDTFSRLAKGG
ncbi:MAG: PilT/PilU family type 4a pilus ATPase [Armatimonadetes bacterium]|nr:PilT/PilU family type 4a pilus ATPase [Armatimonadota bacterium]